MRGMIVLASLFVFLAGFACSVRTQEEVLATGDAFVVRLAPRDPRAFLLGDYMELDYAMNRELDAALRDRFAGGRAERPELPRDACAVVRLDDGKPAAFVRLDDGEALRADERRLYFRVRKGRARIAASAFYFQEGQAGDFARARYGELRVDAAGKSLLVHMLDGDMRRIQPHKDSSRNDPRPTR